MTVPRSSYNGRAMGTSRPLSRAVRIVIVIAGLVAAAAIVAPRPRAQGKPPIAITGARIVDGSGNEPFTGTIVISGGRIAAVGRQVEIPAGAQTIDGAGRTVLPGFIDAAPRAPSDAAATDAGRRRLGRALAAGVTTSAALAAGVPAPSFPGDAVLPRLLAPPAEEAPAAGTPPGAKPFRNGTLGIPVDGDAAAAVAAARTAKARVALTGLAGEDGTLDLTRLVAAGLPPLDTAAALTGGGAWALGLQSDRGLLAPGMRADLVVVAGDPTASLDALSHVERVFLNGSEVDREALLRVPAPPPAAAPQPEPTPAPVAPETRTARGRRGSKARASETPPASTPAASAAAGEPAATATPPAAAAAAVASVRLSDALLDDFERGDSVSAVGPAWVGSASDSATTLIMGRVVKGLRDHALLLSARMGAGQDPVARASLKLDASDRGVDVSRFRGLRFDARGEGRYRVVFVTKGVTDGRYHESYFSGSPLWTPVSIPFASIGQNGNGQKTPWTGRDLVEVRFEMERDAGRLAWMELDNVTFY